MPSTTDSYEEKGIFALFKGDSGAGKSTAALSFPTPFVQDFDCKMPAIALKSFPKKAISWDTYPDIMAVDKQIQEFMVHCPYETIIGDSFTHLMNLVISSLRKTKGDNAAVMKAISTLNAKDQSVQALGMDYYTVEEVFATYYLEQMKKLWLKPGNPKHVIIIAHVVTTESREGPLGSQKIVKTRKIVSKGNKVSAIVPSVFDNAYTFGLQSADLSGGASNRICKTVAYGEEFAKCSYNFPETIDFTNKSFYDQIVPFTSWEKK